MNYKIVGTTETIASDIRGYSNSYVIDEILAMKSGRYFAALTLG